jgi:hypothetical protein
MKEAITKTAIVFMLRVSIDSGMFFIPRVKFLIMSEGFRVGLWLSFLGLQLHFRIVEHGRGGLDTADFKYYKDGFYNIYLRARLDFKVNTQGTKLKPYVRRKNKYFGETTLGGSVGALYTQLGLELDIPKLTSVLIKESKLNKEA